MYSIGDDLCWSEHCPTQKSKKVIKILKNSPEHSDFIIPDTEKQPARLKRNRGI
jgi:hypothetical protein